MAIVQWRRATAAEWTAANPVLRQGEAGYEIGTGKFKIGDGTSTWNSLAYFGASASFTDNSDGGFTSGGVKLAGYNWINTTFAKIANAVALSNADPQPLSTIPSAGTSVDAARIDHIHKIPLARPMVGNIGTGSQFLMGKEGGSITPYQMNRALFGMIWVATPSRKPLVVSKISLNVLTAGASGTTCRFGMWPTTDMGVPIWASPVFTSGTKAADTTGMKDHTASITLAEGAYWVGAVNQGVGAQASWRGMDERDCIQMPGGNTGQMTYNYYLDGVTGALTAVSGANNGGDGVPGLYFTMA